MKRKHIIWDWNGTLLNDVDLSHEITIRHIREQGLEEITLTKSRDIFTMPIAEFYRRLGFDLERTPLSYLQKNFHDEYERRRHECALHQGVEELLQEIRRCERTQSILSAHPTPMLLEMIGHLKLDHFFTEVVGAENNFGHSKIAAGHQWMKSTGRKGDEVTLVGDTTHDHEVAEELGIACVLIAHGYQSKAVLSKCGVPVVESVDELRKELLR